MGNIKQINIKNWTYYFHNNIINIKEFNSRLLKIDIKYKDINIETYPKKKKTKRENMEETDIIICLKKKNKNEKNMKNFPWG